MNIAEPALRSRAVTALSIGAPNGLNLRRWTEHQAGLTLGIGLNMATDDDPNADGFFRIGHMGHVNAQMIMGTLGAIQSGLMASDIPMVRGDWRPRRVCWPRRPTASLAWHLAAFRACGKTVATKAIAAASPHEMRMQRFIGATAGMRINTERATVCSRTARAKSPSPPQSIVTKFVAEAADEAIVLGNLRRVSRLFATFCSISAT